LIEQTKRMRKVIKGSGNSGLLAHSILAGLLWMGIRGNAAKVD
jgi:hypothetical protein